MSAYHEFLAHQDQQKPDLPRRHDTTPSPSVAATPTDTQILAQTSSAPTIANTTVLEQAQWSVSLPVSRTNSNTNGVPYQDFSATISTPQWDVWELPEMPTEPISDDPGLSSVMPNSPPEPLVGYPATALGLAELPPPTPINDGQDWFSMTEISGKPEGPLPPPQTEDSQLGIPGLRGPEYRNRTTIGYLCRGPCVNWRNTSSKRASCPATETGASS